MTGLRPVSPGDAGEIAGIYNHYIRHTAITFEEEPLTAEAMEGRIQGVIPRYPWFVWEEDGLIAGYAYAHAWHQRAAYRYAAEDSVYLRPGWERRGIGKKLLGAVIGELKKRELHVLMAAITVPNPASVGLHEGLGFTGVGRFNEIGFKLGKWLDVGYWELVLNSLGTDLPEGGAGSHRTRPEAGEEAGGRGETSPLIKGLES
jgi:phosphinothricin acetyltransferase